jgi:2-methylcitrate dehydratase
MENVLFKISFPAEFHAQTAVESAMKLHPVVKDRIDQIDRITIETQEAGIRIIDKSGPLDNPADRDHCIQYMVAVALLFGHLTADDYEDVVASDTRIDALREKMIVSENKKFSVDYLEPEKRAIGNAVQIFFQDGNSSERIEIEYPVGHRCRRQEGIPLLLEKFKRNLATRFAKDKVNQIFSICEEQANLESIAVNEFVDEWIRKN